jgi:hypothetical protein
MGPISPTPRLPTPMAIVPEGSCTARRASRTLSSISSRAAGASTRCSTSATRGGSTSLRISSISPYIGFSVCILHPVASSQAQSNRALLYLCSVRGRGKGYAR